MNKVIRGVIIRVLLLTLASFTLVLFEESFDGSDLLSAELTASHWITAIVVIGLIALADALDTLTKTSRLKNVSGHINKKRLGAHRNQMRQLFFCALHVMTVLRFSAVILIASVLLSPGDRPHPVFVRGQSSRLRSKKRFTSL